MPGIHHNSRCFAGDPLSDWNNFRPRRRDGPRKPFGWRLRVEIWWVSVRWLAGGDRQFPGRNWRYVKRSRRLVVGDRDESFFRQRLDSCDQPVKGMGIEQRARQDQLFTEGLRNLDESPSRACSAIGFVRSTLFFIGSCDDFIESAPRTSTKRPLCESRTTHLPVDSRLSSAFAMALYIARNRR